MEKKTYIKPYTSVAMIDGNEAIMEFNINDKSLEADHTPVKDRDYLDEEEEEAAMAAQQQNYSLW